MKDLMLEKCSNCGHGLFSIIIRDSCGDCKHNGAWDEGKGEYTIDEGIIEKQGLVRCQASEEGECSLGTSYDNGCYSFVCEKCKTIEILPISLG